MSPLPSLSKVALVVTVLSSSVSLFCTALTIVRPLLHARKHRRRGISKMSHSRSGNKHSNDPYPWQTNRMAPSPQPSQLTRPSGGTFLAYACSTIQDELQGSPHSSARPMTMIQAALDHLSQIVFLAVIVSTLLQSGMAEPLDLLRHRGVLVTCAFALSLRLLLPLSTTIYTAAVGYRQTQSSGTLVTAISLPALVLALLVACFALIASMYGSQAAACIIVLSITGICLALNSFVSLRLFVIKRRGPTSRSGSSSQQHGKGKQTVLDDNKEGFLASTMSTAGTKASSANPYDTRCKSMLLQEEEKATVEEQCDVLESEYSAATAANDSTEISSLWLNQSLPVQASGDVLHSYHQGKIDDEILLTPPPSASFRSLDGGVAPSPPEIGIDRSGGRLRISPSAREIMVQLSTPLDFYQATLTIDLQSALIGLAGVWLTSILCIPFLAASIVYSQPTLSTQILTLCFIIGIAVSGPLLALQAFKREGGVKSLPLPRPFSTSPLPKASFASSLMTGRTSKASDLSLSHQECPVAGNGFEPVNGYDYPFSPYLPGSYDSDKRVRSVAYASTHWTSGTIVGDRVTSSQGVFGRAANMMSPKPKLQVLSPGRRVKGSNDTMASQVSSKVSDCFDEASSKQSVDAVVQDISETSAIMPGAMPRSPMQSDTLHSTRSMHLERRIDTIHEVDTNTAHSAHTSEDGSPGLPRGATRSLYSPFHRLTTALRKRRATLSEADWVNVSPYTLGRPDSTCEGHQQYTQHESVSVSSHTLTIHRSSVSMSVVQHHSDWCHGEAHEMHSIPDASCSDAELGDMSACSYFSSMAPEVELTAETKASAASQSKEAPRVEEQHGPAKELKENAADDLSALLKQVQQDSDSISRNWKLIGTPSVMETPSGLQRDSDVTLASTRSLANVMGISGEEDQGTGIEHSTPLRRGAGLEASNGRRSDTVRKSLCSEMGFTAGSPGQDSSSPCRTSSDLSSLHHRRLTADTISDSFLSSGVDEELIISPDVTPERMGETEREIVIVEMDESPQKDSGSDGILPAHDDQGAAVYPFSTQRYYTEGAHYLDPVEEVTEEPTIPISEDDQSDQWVYSDSVDDQRVNGQDNDVDSPSSHLQHGYEGQKMTASTPIYTRNAAEEWARLHGFATPSSMAASPQSQYGWAEVIETGKRTTSQLSMQRRSRRSPHSSPHLLNSSPTGRSRLDSNLSAHTRAYLAARLGGTPSRLIGLQSKFWLNSPPSLALDAKVLQSNKRASRSSLMISMSPSAGLGEESSWVDGAIAEDEEAMAQQEMEHCARKWRRKSKNIAAIGRGGDDSPGFGTPVNVKTRSARQRSSASLQSLIDAAVKRGSGAFRGVQQQSRTATSSARSSLASQMTLPSITISADGDDDASLGNRSDVKVVGSSKSSPPSTPRRRSSGEATEYAAGNAPTKSGSTTKSRASRLEPESPSSGKGGSRSMEAASASPKRSSPAAKSAAGRSPAGRSKRASVGGRADYKVHSRKESRVRETARMFELSLRAKLEQQQQLRHQRHAAPDVLSPRKKVQPRELTALPASPGKFRLQEAAAQNADSNDAHGDDDKENASAAPLLKRINRSSRFNLRRPHPQIFVRPPSGDSTATHRLVY